MSHTGKSRDIPSRSELLIKSGEGSSTRSTGQRDVPRTIPRAIGCASITSDRTPEQRFSEFGAAPRCCPPAGTWKSSSALPGLLSGIFSLTVQAVWTVMTHRYLSYETAPWVWGTESSLPMVSEHLDSVEVSLLHCTCCPRLLSTGVTSPSPRTSESLENASAKLTSCAASYALHSSHCA